MFPEYSMLPFFKTLFTMKNSPYWWPTMCLAQCCPLGIKEERQCPYLQGRGNLADVGHTVNESGASHSHKNQVAPALLRIFNIFFPDHFSYRLQAPWPHISHFYCPRICLTQCLAHNECTNRWIDMSKWNWVISMHHEWLFKNGFD